MNDTLTLRRATVQDAEVCGRICYEAFAAISGQHNFPRDLPSPEAAIGNLTAMFSHPGFWAVVAEIDGRILGSNVLDERTPVAGVGPITVDPTVQNGGIGRRLMDAVMDRSREQGFQAVRLLQSTYHCRSLSLYTKLGFVTRDLLVVMQGEPLNIQIPGYPVRPATQADLPAANAVCLAVHDHDRSGELADAIAQGRASVVEHHGQVTGYTTGMGFMDHAVASSNTAMRALISAAPAFPGPGFLLPARNHELFQWCLAQGLRVQYPMTLMTVGLYSEPRGAWMPSVLY